MFSMTHFRRIIPAKWGGTGLAHFVGFCYTGKKKGGMDMKKRICLVLLVLVLMIAIIPPVRAVENLCFVAMNDTIPTTLKNNGIPYYTNSRLFIPFTAFNASPNGVGASYNVEKNTFVLYNAYETLLFDLENDTFTNSADEKFEVEVAYRSGMLYVPASVVSHFGLYVTLLFSHDGYPIIRFTNGDQVYDDGMFVAQAESLITRAAKEYENELGQQAWVPVVEPDDPEPEPPQPAAPIEIYLAFQGEAVSRHTLDRLEVHNVRAAFFLTEAQILQEKNLVRAIYAAGHTIGLAISTEEKDAEDALMRANDALDQVLFFRSVLVLLPADAQAELSSVHILREPEALTVEQLIETAKGPVLYVVSEGAPGVIASLADAGAAMLKLRETTF